MTDWQKNFNNLTCGDFGLCRERVDALNVRRKHLSQISSDTWAISVFLTFFLFETFDTKSPWIRSPHFPPGWSKWQVWSKTNERETKSQIFSCWIWNNAVIKAERWPNGPVIQSSWFLWRHTLTWNSFTYSSSLKAAQQHCWNDLHRHASDPSLP